MIGISAVWIVLLLGLGGFALDRVLTSAITSNFDAQLDYVLTAMISSSEIGPEGEVLFNRALADQRFLEPYSGLYFQITGDGFEPYPVALALGPAAERRARTTTPRPIITTATNSRPRNCGSSSATSACRARRCAGASRSRRAAT